MSFKTLNQIGDIKGKKILLRLDLNAPIENGKVADDFRIKASMQTLDFLKNAGAKTLIIAHHDGEKEKQSLKPVADYLNAILPVKFCADFEEAKKALLEMGAGEFAVLENLRKWDGEKANDEKFARELSALGEIFVNEAFSVSHRKHASIVGVPKFLPSFAGYLFEKEVAELSKAFKPARPFLFILGGAKFDTKLPLVEKFLKTADNVFIGGALANDLLCAKGCEIGLSCVSESNIAFDNIVSNKKLLLPVDVVARNGEAVFERKFNCLAKNDEIVDAGNETLKELGALISKAKFILWNGPLGMYESGFSAGTEKVAELVSESGAISIVGGGDTVAVIDKMNLRDKFAFVSTGGGAMLDFLAEGTLPGIQALEKRN